jgi:hypothetical protein
MPTLIVVFSIMVGISQMIKVFIKDNNARLVYYNIVGLSFGFYLHGFGAIWLYLMVIVNYAAGA